MCVFTCNINRGEENSGEGSERDVVAERREKLHRESGTHLVEPHGTHVDTRVHRAKTHSPNSRNARDTLSTMRDTHTLGPFLAGGSRPLRPNRVNSLDFLILSFSHSLSLSHTHTHTDTHTHSKVSHFGSNRGVLYHVSSLACLMTPPHPPSTLMPYRKELLGHVRDNKISQENGNRR